MKRNRKWTTITVTFAAYRKTSSEQIRFVNVKHFKLDKLHEQTKLDKATLSAFNEGIKTSVYQFVRDFDA